MGKHRVLFLKDFLPFMWKTVGGDGVSETDRLFKAYLECFKCDSGLRALGLSEYCCCKGCVEE